MQKYVFFIKLWKKVSELFSLLIRRKFGDELEAIGNAFIIVNKCTFIAFYTAILFYSGTSN